MLNFIVNQLHSCASYFQSPDNNATMITKNTQPNKLSYSAEPSSNNTKDIKEKRALKFPSSRAEGHEYANNKPLYISHSTRVSGTIMPTAVVGPGDAITNSAVPSLSSVLATPGGDLNKINAARVAVVAYLYGNPGRLEDLHINRQKDHTNPERLYTSITYGTDTPNKEQVLFSDFTKTVKKTHVERMIFAYENAGVDELLASWPMN
ncbi:MAG: hypothetical protein QS721_00720 [Candidatus Endonucleobacter sp. (ex Gigantidas childressi)]|nr:hypothetical protein [Candidatus Endonucleobacter sp. (ex Gigantidas childressi)]